MSAPSNEIKKITLKIGDYEICPLPTGTFGLDGGAMFGTVPKVLWEKSNPADDKNRIVMEARSLLLRSKNRNIIIDTGNGTDFVQKYGEKLGGKFAQMYNMDDSGPSLMKSLNHFGLGVEQIDEVILTHLHFDHAGGGTCFKDGKIRATFPRARYHLQNANLETAKNPNLRERASYFTANFEPLIESKQLHLHHGPVEDLLPGISLLVSNGHTQGQQMVKVSDGKTSLLYCADVVPTSSHVRLPWLMGYDLNPLLLMEEKSFFLGPAADEKWYLYFEHDPYCDAARIDRHGNDFQVSERYWL